MTIKGSFTFNKLKKIMKFCDIQFEQHPAFSNGICARVTFDNNYGVSIVRFPGSYGHYDGLYECAILMYSDDDWRICHHTQVHRHWNTDDVIGYMSEEQVELLIKDVESIPSDVSAEHVEELKFEVNFSSVFSYSPHESYYKLCRRNNTVPTKEGFRLYCLQLIQDSIVEEFKIFGIDDYVREL